MLVEDTVLLAEDAAWVTKIRQASIYFCNLPPSASMQLLYHRHGSLYCMYNLACFTGVSRLDILRKHNVTGFLPPVVQDGTRPSLPLERYPSRRTPRDSCAILAIERQDRPRLGSGRSTGSYREPLQCCVRV